MYYGICASSEVFIFSLGTYNGPKRNWKQCLCKILAGQTKSVMVFLILANSTSIAITLLSLLKVLRFQPVPRLTLLKRCSHPYFSSLK